MNLTRWACVPVTGLALVAWGYFGAPRPAPTAIFSTAALFILAGGAIAVAGTIVLIVKYTGEQNRRRAQALAGSDSWPPKLDGPDGPAARP